MHVERLELALHEVDHDEGEGEAGGEGRAGEVVGRVRVLENVGSQEPDCGVDEHGAEVLDYENDLPVYLWALRRGGRVSEYSWIGSGWRTTHRDP